MSLKVIFFLKYLTPIFYLYIVIHLLSMPVLADSTVECNIGIGSESIECGVNSSANSTKTSAIGHASKALVTHSTAIGSDSKANGGNSTSIGYDAKTDGAQSIAIGSSSSASGDFSVSNGAESHSHSWGKISIGYSAGKNSSIPVTDSRASIAIGYYSNIGELSAGAIAIGGDTIDPDVKGAEAVAPGAIALGADVYNDVPNSMLINVPLRIEASDNQLLLLENTVNNLATRRLLKMTNNGPVGFEMEDTDRADIWQFRSDSSGKFVMNLLGNLGAEFSVDGNGNGRFEGEVRANGILLTSSRESKTDIDPIKPSEVMAKLKQVEIAEWRYKKADKNDRHISPMAEDFYSLFKLGRDGKSINPNDLASVALVAAKELQKKTVNLETENSELKKQLEAQNKRLAQLEKLVINLASGETSLPTEGKQIVLNQ